MVVVTTWACGTGDGVNATSNQTGDVRHVNHQISANAVGDFAEPLPVPDTGIGSAAGQDQLGLVFVGKALDLIHVEKMVVLTHAIGDDVEPLAGHVDRGTVGQVTTGVEIQAHEGVARLQKSQEHCLVHLAAGVRLNVGKLAAEKFLRALDCQRFGNVGEFTAAIVALARITFGIFVGEDRALCFQHCAGNDVFRSNQLDFMLLTAEFLADRVEDIRIGFSKAAGEETGLQGLIGAFHQRHSAILVFF